VKWSTFVAEAALAALVGLSGCASGSSGEGGRIPSSPPGARLLARRPAELAVFGYVKDDSTGVPLRGAAVVIADLMYGTLSNSEGRFRLVLPGPGEYTLVAHKQGYAPDTVHVEIAAEPISVDFSLRHKADSDGVLALRKTDGLHHRRGVGLPAAGGSQCLRDSMTLRFWRR
jgi:hypothetical protein